MLWPDTAETSARNNFRYSLWQLRQTLSPPAGEPPFLLSADLTVAFNAAAPHWLDVALLHNQVESSTAELLAAADVYRGELLPGLYDEWITLERERLRAQYENRIQQLLDRLTHERRWPELRQWSERWLALGHIPEPAYRALMVAHAGLGDSSGIVATYQRCLEVLDLELGVIPSPATRVRSERLLRAINGNLPPEVLLGHIGARTKIIRA